jgi:hypothetical protein
MKIVAILHRSAGNESVGDMWRETKVFDEITPLADVFKWATSACGVDERYYTQFRGHLEITVVQEDAKVKDNTTTLGSMAGL